jgi:acyl-CoA synthetase (AMP-forming)/AMP-acid ligase II
MFVDPVGFQARRQPDAVAVCLPDGDVTFKSFDASIDAVAAGLAGRVAAGARVAVVVSDRYVHWLYLLALGRLGALSVSVNPAKSAPALDQIRPDVVVCEESVGLPGREIIAVPEVAASPPARPPTRLHYAPGAPLRLIRSSGTTGTPKLVQLDRAQAYRRAIESALMAPDCWSGRVLTIMGFETLAGYFGPLAAWLLGGAACFFTPSVEMIVRRRVTALIASPAQFEGLIAALARGFVPPSGMCAVVMGGIVTRQFAVRLRVKLAPHAFTVYGSTETGMVATAPLECIDETEGLAGILVPGCAAEAVDATGLPLPPGEVGEIRVRNEHMVPGYLDDPVATGRLFRDGWFHPGDLGSVAADGRVRILGRIDDVLNVGGAKIAPDSVEEILKAVAGFRDAAVFVAADGRGAGKLYAAVVADGWFDEAAVLAEVNRRLPMGRRSLGFMRIDSIPRNAMGKVQRADLARQFEAARRRRERMPA